MHEGNVDIFPVFQLQVLSLYKQCMRAAELKPGFRVNVQQEFRKYDKIQLYVS